MTTHSLSRTLFYSLLLSLLVLVSGCGSNDDSNETHDTDDDSAVDIVDTSDADDASDDDVQDDGGDTADVGDGVDASDVMDEELPPDTEYPYERLSSYGFFDGPLAEHNPVDGVVPYEVNSTLYADQSQKFRFIRLPENGQIEFSADGRWSFPEGTIVIKTFYYPVDKRDPDAGRRLIETRLLVRVADDWEAQIYLWNDAQTEANRFIVGTDVPVEFIDDEGETVNVDYIVPDRNQCKNCHDQSREMVLLGPKTIQMNRDNDYGNGPVNQLAYFESEGMFTAPLPDIPDNLPRMPNHLDESATLHDRARAYLDANCSHCHNPDGSASSSGLSLAWTVDRDIDLGICRRPFAAGAGSGGRSFDIVPGASDESIMVYRMSSVDPEIKMPELPTRTVDEDGLAIITAWIDAMPATTCE